jgi:hypothetical protein
VEIWQEVGMRNWFSKAVGSSGHCDAVCEVLERTGNLETSDPVDAIGALLAGLPEQMRKHIYSCERCRVFADDLLEARAMFEERKFGAQPGPYFLARVMASIEDREQQLERSAQTWAAVPRLASRLAVLASLGLLLAASWVYQMPKNSGAGMSSQQVSEALVDNGTSQDDLLLSAGR